MWPNSGPATATGIWHTADGDRWVAFPLQPVSLFDPVDMPMPLTVVVDDVGAWRWVDPNLDDGHLSPGSLPGHRAEAERLLSNFVWVVARTADADADPSGHETVAMWRRMGHVAGFDRQRKAMSAGNTAEACLRRSRWGQRQLPRVVAVTGRFLGELMNLDRARLVELVLATDGDHIVEALDRAGVDPTVETWLASTVKAVLDSVDAHTGTPRRGDDRVHRLVLLPVGDHDLLVDGSADRVADAAVAVADAAFGPEEPGDDVLDDPSTATAARVLMGLLLRHRPDVVADVVTTAATAHPAAAAVAVLDEQTVEVPEDIERQVRAAVGLCVDAAELAATGIVAGSSPFQMRGSRTVSRPQAVTVGTDGTIRAVAAR